MDIGVKIEEDLRAGQGRYTLVVGDDPHLSMVMAMATRLGWGNRCLRFVNVDEAKVFAREHQIERIVATTEIKNAAIIDSSGRRVPVVHANDLLRRTMGRISLAEVDTLTLDGAIRRPRPIYSGVKRALDIVFSVLALLFLALPTLLFSVVIRLWRGCWPSVAKKAVVGKDGLAFPLPRLTPGHEPGNDSIGVLRAKLVLHATGLEFVPSLIQVLTGQMRLSPRVMERFRC